MTEREQRLERIIDVLCEQARNGDVVTATLLARECGVSQRAIYRAIQLLRGRGHRIDASRGIGYMIRNKGAK